MLIKNTILDECYLYAQQAKRNVLFNNHHSSISQTKVKLVNKKPRISNQDPTWLLCMAILRLYKPGDSFSTFYNRVFSQQEGLALESYLVAESTAGKLIAGTYFGDKSITVGLLDVSEPTDVTLSPIHVLYSHDTTTGGITPLFRRHTCYGDYTIVYSLFLITKALFNDYCTHSSKEEDGRVIFKHNLSDFIYSSFYIPSVDSCLSRSMFNRYHALLNGEQVEEAIPYMGFSVPDYTEKLNKEQQELVDTAAANDVRKAFYLLPISPDKTLMNLLEEDLSVIYPLNHQWVEILNELQWAEFYLDLGGGRRAIDNAIKRYIKRLRSQNLIGACPYGNYKEVIEEKIRLVEYAL